MQSQSDTPKVSRHHPVLAGWIKENTAGAACVVDFGAGFYDKLRNVGPMVKKVGLEIFPAYLAYAPPGVAAICVDMRDWAKVVEKPDRDTAMLIDVIEHIPKKDGLKLLAELKEEFKRVLVMTPDGFMPQFHDVTGYENEYQVHECGWSAEELRDLGFTVSVLPDFHEEKGGALFAVWRRDE